MHVILKAIKIVILFRFLNIYLKKTNKLFRLMFLTLKLQVSIKSNNTKSFIETKPELFGFSYN